MPRAKKHRLAPTKGELAEFASEPESASSEVDSESESGPLSSVLRVATEEDAKGAKLTPAMKQYFAVREKHPDAVLLFQMGDFYETFFQDAETLANVLSVTLTRRGHAGGAPIPLAGFPVKALDGYLPKLVAAGLRVVICEQVEDARDAVGVVERDVTRVVTAGTVLEDSLLDPARSNYIAALAFGGKAGIGVAWAELSTGEFMVMRTEQAELPSVLARIGPAELVVSKDVGPGERVLAKGLAERHGAMLTDGAEWTFALPQALKALKSHFGVATLGGFGLTEESGPEVAAAGALLLLLKEQQRSELRHIAKLEVCHVAGTIPLDAATVAALELAETLRGRSRKHSLVWALDRCRTSMGSRLLRQWVMAPLTGRKAVELRHGAVDELLHSAHRREMLRGALERLGDLERLAGRLGCGRATPRDLVALGAALDRVPLLQNALAGAESSMLAEIAARLDPVDELGSLVRSALNDDPPTTVKDGGVIRDGYDRELDRLRSMRTDGRRFIAQFQQEAAERAGIPSLKIGYTSVFGYYLEVSNAHREKVPADWIRKQTLTGRERYVTPDLMETEKQVLNSDAEALRLEAELYAKVKAEAAQYAGRVIAISRLIAMADLLGAFAEQAAERGYVRPVMTDGDELEIVDGRHPVLDLTLEPGRLVPNDCLLGAEHSLALITGPNMAGKSTYIRMCALLVLMAQCGSFVPAQSMRLGMVDRLFTRLGSADEIQRGNSTFMVEMVETAGILNAATGRSLIVLDEVGRGTSTYDGVSIAWAVSEYLARDLGARTLFATHYHELTQLAARLPRVKNLNVSVREWQDDVIFLHRIIDGAADRSYGIHVARLAGIPGPVIDRARDIMAKLEAETAAAQIGGNAGTFLKRPRKVQLTLFTPMESQILRKLVGIELDGVPVEVLKAEIARLQALASEELGS